MRTDRALTPEQEKDILRAHREGELGKELAAKYGVHPSTITRTIQRFMQRNTKRTVSELTYLSAIKLREALLAADPQDKDDRKFIAEAFKLGADRDGLSPQAVAVQLNQNLAVAVQVQPLLASTEEETIKTLLKGEEE